MEVEARCILQSPGYGCRKHGIGDFLVGAGGKNTSRNSNVATEESRMPYWERFVVGFLLGSQTQLMPKMQGTALINCRALRRVLQDDHFMNPSSTITPCLSSFRGDDYLLVLRPSLQRFDWI